MINLHQNAKKLSYDNYDQGVVKEFLNIWIWISPNGINV